MPTPHSYGFAYFTGGTPPSDVLVQSNLLLVATGRTLPNAFKWWEGPNFQLGYVIGFYSPSRPTQIAGVTANVGFFRSQSLTDASFIELGNVVARSFFEPQRQWNRASQVATYINFNDYNYTTWSSPIGKILYSGDTYNNLWVPGDTSLATTSRIVSCIYRQDYLELAIEITGNASAYGTWELINRTLNPGDYPYSTLLVDIETFTTMNVEVFVTDGVTTVSNTNSGTGVETISVNISTLSSGFITCSIYAQKSCIGCGNNQLYIYKVQLAQDTSIITPYPYPNVALNDDTLKWADMILETGVYPFSEFQIRGTNTDITLSINYTKQYCYVAIKVTNTQITNFDIETNPLDQGFSFFDTSTSFDVSPNQWVSLSLYNPLTNGSEIISILNDDDSGVELAAITITNQ